MRLRSSQFVFLMLLLCSVQMRDECALHLAAPSLHATQLAPSTATPAVTHPVPSRHVTRRQITSAIPSRERTAFVTGPAQAAMSVTSHTSLIRA